MCQTLLLQILQETEDTVVQLEQSNPVIDSTIFSALLIYIYSDIQPHPDVGVSIICFFFSKSLLAA